MSEPYPSAAPPDERPHEEPSSAQSVVVARPRHELYAFWRDFTNFPKFMEKVRKVTEIDSLSSIWTVEDAGGQTAEWEFMVTDDERDRLIAWAASGNTPVKYSARVEFTDAPNGSSTVITASVRYEPPSGLLENLIAQVGGPPSTAQTREDLVRFKQLMERGAGSRES